MKKTSVYLTESEADLLRNLAEREGRSQASILREALLAYDEQSLPDREFAVFNTGEGDGRSVADIPEEELMRGFGGYMGLENAVPYVLPYIHEEDECVSDGSRGGHPQEPG